MSVFTSSPVSLDPRAGQPSLGSAVFADFCPCSGVSTEGVGEKVGCADITCCGTPLFREEGESKADCGSELITVAAGWVGNDRLLSEADDASCPSTVCLCGGSAASFLLIGSCSYRRSASVITDCGSSFFGPSASAFGKLALPRCSAPTTLSDPVSS